LPCEACREARWCFGGIADVLSDIEDGGIVEGAIAGAGAEGGGAAVERGPVL
jgi:hypothetical protein